MRRHLGVTEGGQFAWAVAMFDVLPFSSAFGTWSVFFFTSIS